MTDLNIKETQIAIKKIKDYYEKELAKKLNLIWEKIIREEDRNEKYLKKTVKSIYSVFKSTERYINSIYPFLKYKLPDEIFFIDSQDLENKYYNKTPEEREYLITKEYGAVFIMKIGNKLRSGIPHDYRAPDYDDWELNGDIVFYNPILDEAFELSSMGIRVDKNALPKQLKKAGVKERLKLDYCKLLMEDKLPYTIGGGIGQSRICMFFLEKRHIGEVQASIWPEAYLQNSKEQEIFLL